MCISLVTGKQQDAFSMTLSIQKWTEQLDLDDKLTENTHNSYDTINEWNKRLDG
jgi:hypothetical protein